MNTSPRFAIYIQYHYSLVLKLLYADSTVCICIRRYASGRKKYAHFITLYMPILQHSLLSNVNSEALTTLQMCIVQLYVPLNITCPQGETVVIYIVQTNIYLKSLSNALNVCASTVKCKYKRQFLYC
jgi:hypothetical protein